jgi:hypothetical protein
MDLAYFLQASQNQLYTNELQRDVAWLIVKLEECNRQIEQLQKSSKDDVMRVPLQLLSEEFKPWLSQISPKCKTAAKNIVTEKLSNSTVTSPRADEMITEQTPDESERATTTPQNTPTAETGIADTISACISLLLYLAECAEADLSEVEVKFALQNALTACRPKFDANFGYVEFICF